MKRILLLLLCLGGLQAALAQAPTITGDTMMCPYTDGTATITNGITYDSYQWFSKFWFTEDEYVAIEGATAASFTYDWFTYDQSLFKVVVTLNNETFESNAIQIDSYNWMGFSVNYPIDNDTMTYNPDTEGFFLCEGATVLLSTNEFFINMEWYKDGVLLPGETGNTYLITGPGSYHAVGYAGVCPQNSNSNVGQPIVVDMNSECNLSIDNPELASTIKLYPNPAKNFLNLELGNSSEFTSYSIIDISGKVLAEQTITSENNIIPVNHLSDGFYILKLDGNNFSTTKKFIKN
ncbi:T9SS type A sorting domain-containing protein [Flavobacterium macacae]|uniref:T9SS C-terminal target domain-containing protein n=1 Tax=Flavobacterium macacae TaxID=2488993 RepID=A0A3P3W4H1_9FLAO|nr:T9SS type A sorting domain-containing protein [Flavobacterium macacae]RRJ89975.1 T9SS C-terminal target domain-containing protein [Flavobacterium macacae]